MAKKVSETVYYIAVIVAVFNCIAFIVEGSWTPLLFFLLATFATFSIKPDKTLALITGIVVSNLYRATAGVHEGMTSGKSTRDLDSDSSDGLDTEMSIKKAMKAPSKTVPKPTMSKPTVKSNQDLELDNIMGGNGSLEGLMARQTKLMKNLKDMQPMMAQAKNMLNSLPKGFVKKALEQFKQ